MLPDRRSTRRPDPGAGGGRRGIAAVLIIVMLGLVVMAAFSGYFQVSTHRRMLERLYAHRLMVLAATSAFEEASAFVEGLNQNVPALSTDPTQAQAMITNPRNLKTTLNFPSEMSPDQTRAQYKDQSVTVSGVRLVSSDWVLRGVRTGQDSAGVTVQIHEVGVLGLQVDIRVQAGSSTLKGTVSCRRHMDSSPDQSGGPLRLHVLPRNMVFQVPGGT